MIWFMLIFSVIATLSGLYGIKWHKELNFELEHGNPYNVEYLDYLISAYSYLLTPIASICTLVCVYLLFLKLS